MSARSGQHAGLGYCFEDNGFDTEPTDTTIKVFGSNATLDTFEGSKEAVRVFNNGRVPAEVVEQVFDGSWSVTCQLSEPPWWLAGLFGQPTSTQIVDVYDHEYAIGNGNDPVPLRLYAPTDGFNEYEVLPGCVISQVTVDQSVPGNPELSISGAYAREPFRDDTLDVSIPAFSSFVKTFTNCDAELQVGGDTVGSVQSSSIDYNGNVDMVTEVGSCSAVDFSPKAWNVDPQYDKIVSVDQTVDPLDRFLNGGEVEVSLTYDNGLTGADAYSIEWLATGSTPNQWSETGRNDPESDLIEELQDLALDGSATVTAPVESPPGV